MLCLAFAAHMFVLAHFHHTLPCVPASANRWSESTAFLVHLFEFCCELFPCRLMRWLVMRLLKLLKTRKEEMIGLGLTQSDGSIKVGYLGMLWHLNSSELPDDVLLILIEFITLMWVGEEDSSFSMCEHDTPVSVVLMVLQVRVVTNHRRNWCWSCQLFG